MLFAAVEGVKGNGAGLRVVQTSEVITGRVGGELRRFVMPVLDVDTERECNENKKMTI